MTRLGAFWMGFVEGLGDFGMTWNDDPYDALSVAYDYGRSLRRWIARADD